MAKAAKRITSILRCALYCRFKCEFCVSFRKSFISLVCFRRARTLFTSTFSARNKAGSGMMLTGSSSGFVAGCAGCGAGAGWAKSSEETSCADTCGADAPGVGGRVAGFTSLCTTGKVEDGSGGSVGGVDAPQTAVYQGAAPVFQALQQFREVFFALQGAGQSQHSFLQARKPGNAKCGRDPPGRGVPPNHKCSVKIL